MRITDDIDEHKRPDFSPLMRASETAGSTPQAAADVLRDLFGRGKCPDVILPMCVTRRMDAVRLPDEAPPEATDNDTDLSLDPEAADEEAAVE